MCPVCPGLIIALDNPDLYKETKYYDPIEISNDIVKIYGYAEYDCTENKYRLTKETPMIPFLKINQWYTRKQFHEAYHPHTS